MACIRLTRDQNGYVVCATDPKIAAENQKPGAATNWRDPEREYHFDTCAKALEFIEEIAEKALPLEPAPPDPFEAAFKEASGEDEEDGEREKRGKSK